MSKLFPMSFERKFVLSCIWFSLAFSGFSGFSFRSYLLLLVLFSPDIPGSFYPAH